MILPRCIQKTRVASPRLAGLGCIEKVVDVSIVLEMDDREAMRDTDASLIVVAQSMARQSRVCSGVVRT